MTFLETIMSRGGPVMWPLLLSSLVALTFVFERLIFWWRAGRRRSETNVERILTLVEQGDYAAAGEAGGSVTDACMRVLRAGLLHRDHGLTEAMQIQAGREVDRMRKGMAVLDTLITLAPLLGILGTVTGIIESFDLLGTSDVGDPRSVSSGIAEALITTAAGLTISMMTLIPYNYLLTRIQREAREIEHASTQMEVVYRRSREGAASAAR